MKKTQLKFSKTSLVTAIALAGGLSAGVAAASGQNTLIVEGSEGQAVCGTVGEVVLQGSKVILKNVTGCQLTDDDGNTVKPEQPEPEQPEPEQPEPEQPEPEQPEPEQPEPEQPEVGIQQPGGIAKEWPAGTVFGSYPNREETLRGANGGKYHYYKIDVPSTVSQLAQINVAPYGTAGGYNMWISNAPGGEAIRRCDSVLSATSSVTLMAYVNMDAKSTKCKLSTGTYYLNIADGVGGRFDWKESNSSCKLASGCRYRLAIN